jgi:hypothetical protein
MDCYWHFASPRTPKALMSPTIRFGSAEIYAVIIKPQEGKKLPSAWVQSIKETISTSR